MSARRRSSLLKGVVLNTEAQAAFLDCVLDEFIAAILLLERRANKDYSPEHVRRVSEIRWTEGCATDGQDKPWQLFEAWVKARKPAASGGEQVALRVSRP